MSIIFSPGSPYLILQQQPRRRRGDDGLDHHLCQKIIICLGVDFPRLHRSQQQHRIWRGVGGRGGGGG